MKKGEMKKGFTLMELAVSIGLLAMIILFSTVIFRVSIEAQRVALADTEIMQKLRAITDQLNSDFAGLRREAGIVVGFDVSGEVRTDSMTFVATGDFQSTGQYGSGPKTILGNVASIFYGQSSTPDPHATDPGDPRNDLEIRRKKILTRRQTILTSDDSGDLVDDSDPRGEYYLYSLSEWVAAPPFSLTDPNDWIVRPALDVSDANDLVMYMAKGVDDFSIEIETGIGMDGIWDWWSTAGTGTYEGIPRAIKFSFTLYDSKGIIEKGKRFTHIVYLGD
ncbi:MAG: prepilin-type N-terminal cleavage/methylation domain-containing protein [Planctomycetes bacterium]|nr:prepilin-type N-terminal cleavage/methylation domain-containing protein [Planctomycetota bacterium]